MRRSTLTAVLLALVSVVAAAPPGVASAQAASPGDEDDAWWRDLRVDAFIDGYYLADWNRPADPGANSDGIVHRAFDRNHGFGLAFAGLGARYATEDVGLTVDLRFGGAQAALIAAPVAEYVALKEAYASWRPTDALQLDVGQFDTLYGGESADSWRNPNYTRGALYFMQPFYHLGLRATWDLGCLVLRGMVVNGTNLAVTDDNQSPHLGLQAIVLPADDVEIAAGYYTGASSSGYGAAAAPGDDDQWEHFFDLVLRAAFFDRLRLALNGSLYVSAPDDDALFYGIALTAAVDVSSMVALALRGELLGDTAALVTQGQYERLGTLTATLDVRPLPQLVLRLDTRLEVSDTDLYADQDTQRTGALRSTYLSSTLGVVVTTDP
ncbi:MAG: porin [Myxococcota bacterium]